VRLFSEADVDRLIDRTMALNAATEAFRLHAIGGMLPPGRIDLRGAAPRHGVLTLVGLAADGALSIKTNVHSHAGDAGARVGASLLTLWDAKQAQPLALISGARFNQHRTASGFAAACQVLARPTASTLTIFGAGAMAPEAIRYIVAIRPIRSVIIVGRDPGRVAALVAAAQQWPDLDGISVKAETDTAAAAAAADIIVAVTSAETAVFPGDAVRPGTTVVLGGANRPDAREADDALIRRATVYVDHLEGCLARAGDIRVPLAAEVLARSQIIGEIGAITQAPPGADITVFKSIGIASQDLALARCLLERAGRGDGLWFDPLGKSPGAAIDP